MKTADTQTVYGLNPAFEVLRAGRRRVQSALLLENSERNKRLCRLAEMLRERGVVPSYVDKGKLQQTAGSRDHQGALLHCSPYPYVESADFWEQGERVLLLDNIEDPHNTGAILRSAEVFGFDRVLLPSRGSPEIYGSVVKVSAGASEHLQIARDRSANQYAKAAKAAGFALAALDGSGSVKLKDAPQMLTEPYLLVIGGEDRAVGQFILNEADAVIRIEQQGRINSLNASVAAGIAMAFLADGRT